MTLTQRVRRFDWLSAMVAFPFSAVIAWLFLATIDRQPPLIYIEAQSVQTSVPAGGQLEIRFDVERQRICQTLSVSRYILAATGDEYAVNAYTVSTETRPGRERYDRTITVPENVPPGPAEYFIRLKYACNVIHNLGWPILVESPRVRFTVERSSTEGYNVTPLPERPQPAY